MSTTHTKQARPVFPSPSSGKGPVYFGQAHKAVLQHERRRLQPSRVICSSTGEISTLQPITRDVGRAVPGREAWMCISRNSWNQRRFVKAAMQIPDASRDRRALIGYQALTTAECRLVAFAASTTPYACRCPCGQ